jgi:23S rRNA (pseudouridine1915-N3)-methyltransferase
MKVELWLIGKTDAAYLKDGIAVYAKRLQHYTAFDITVLPDVKITNLSPDNLKDKEGQFILQKIQNDDYLILLDERGALMTSLQFADFIEKKQLASIKRVVFLVGGAFGFSALVYQRANAQISLSKMTFSHQMIRLFFVEQLYRAFTILRGEKYHNE